MATLTAVYGSSPVTQTIPVCGVAMRCATIVRCPTQSRCALTGCRRDGPTLSAWSSGRRKRRSAQGVGRVMGLGSGNPPAGIRVYFCTVAHFSFPSFAMSTHSDCADTGDDPVFFKIGIVRLRLAHISAYYVGTAGIPVVYVLGKKLNLQQDYAHRLSALDQLLGCS